MSYKTWKPDEAVQELQNRGLDAADAQRLVLDHLAAATARYGEPLGGWILDEYELAEIRQRHDAEILPLDEAVRAVVQDYREEHPDATIAEAISSTRTELDHDDIDVLVEHGYMSPEVAAAHRAVLNAEDAALRDAGVDQPARSSVAQADDSSPSWMGGPANPTPPREGGSLEVTRGHSASYRGPYNSHGQFADDLRTSGHDNDGQVHAPTRESRAATRPPASPERESLRAWAPAYYGGVDPQTGLLAYHLDDADAFRNAWIDARMAGADDSAALQAAHAAARQQALTRSSNVPDVDGPSSSARIEPADIDHQPRKAGADMSLTSHEPHHLATRRTRGHARTSTRDEEVTGVIAEFQHANPAVAVAAAAGAVARAAGLDPNSPVIVVVTEDVVAPCDEDGGF